MLRIFAISCVVAKASEPLNCIQMKENLETWEAQNPTTIPSESEAGMVLARSAPLGNFLAAKDGSGTFCHLAACEVFFALKRKVMKRFLQVAATAADVPTSVVETQETSVQQEYPGTLDENTKPISEEIIGSSTDANAETNVVVPGVVQPHENNRRSDITPSESSEARTAIVEDHRLNELVRALSGLVNIFQGNRDLDDYQYCATKYMRAVEHAGLVARIPVRCNMVKGLFAQKFRPVDDSYSVNLQHFVGAIDSHFALPGTFKHHTPCNFRLCEASYKIAFGWAKDGKDTEVQEASSAITPFITEEPDCSASQDILKGKKFTSLDRLFENDKQFIFFFEKH
jgi:hypothetical protein